MASLKDLAAQLGLSITTVSRALAGYSDVSAETRARVKAMADAAGYRPHPIGRLLRHGRSEAIGVVLPAEPGHFTDPFFTELLVGLGEALARVDHDLIVTAARPGAEEMKVYRRLIEGRRVDGIVLARTRIKDERIGYLLDQGFPFVTHGRTDETRAYAHVDADGEAAFVAATRRLVELGHRRIALVNAPAAYSFAHHREAGWRKAMRETGMRADILVAGEANEETGFTLAGGLLDARDPPTALLCATDRLAVGALRAVTARGLRPGRDISLIGYDDLPIATYTDPPLTTIAQPIRAMAVRLIEMLLARIGGAAAKDLAEVWPATLVARASDGPAPTTPTQPTPKGGSHAQKELRRPV
ncbi:MAG: LacI family DNA-binding transcriptional regulator [Alphaproteobacteria bacterium]|nr:LacI family DNA-binding transcriptional regulator [Alphaproteobacteria bacterium]